MSAIARIEFEWDGERLYCRLLTLPAWRALCGSETDSTDWWSTWCTGPDDLTAFELGLLAHRAVSELTDRWETERDLTARERLIGPVLFGPLLKTQVQQEGELDGDQSEHH